MTLLFSHGHAIPILAVALAPLLATLTMATACAVLSLFVIARRWALIGEGISHSGFGGAGFAWLLILIVPALGGHPWIPYAAVIIFCLGTALAIGSITRGEHVAGDAAIGIFLVASLGFGFFASAVYQHARGGQPQDFSSLLFGGEDAFVTAAGSALALGTIAVSLAVIVVLAALGKEILSYCFDPLMAQASGVRAGFIHYLLMVLIALTIIVGMPVIGATMVTALLVLPGVTATLLSQRLKPVLAISVATALLAALAGVALNATWHFLPLGPLIVLTLFVEFLLAYGIARVRSRRSSV
jgi:ABC-type Mn2+/Zn2+ transport system permease subunit